MTCFRRPPQTDLVFSPRLRWKILALVLLLPILLLVGTILSPMPIDHQPRGVSVSAARCIHSVPTPDGHSLGCSRPGGLPAF